MKKLLTTILDQILGAANGKKNNTEAPKIDLSEADEQDFRTLQKALKEKKSEAALEGAKRIIKETGRMYELEPFKNTTDIKLDPALEHSIDTLVKMNRSKVGDNTTLFIAGHSSKEFSAPKIEVSGLIPVKDGFKEGIFTVINDNNKINLSLATLLTTLEMALFANNRKISNELQLKLIEAALANTKSAAATSAESQAKAAVAEMN
jgi:hypothetical protein